MDLELPQTSLSVAEVTLYIKDLLEDDRLLQRLWVLGEVSSCNNHPRGLFFTLTDPDAVASIRCVVWGNLRAKLLQQPQQGEQVVVLGSLRLYAQRGEYQLNVWQVLPAGEGLQTLRYQQLRSRLEAEGLFAPERKLTLPPHPQTIAVVTSPSAAAWGDIQRTLTQRYPGLSVLLSPAIVQGEQAPDSIIQAIERVNRDRRAEVLILARGGGAVEDLSCFNDEGVVKAIAASTIPIITGIGHQRDKSLADLAADRCAHTPTAAAEIAVPALAQLCWEHQHRRKRLLTAIERRFNQEVEYLFSLRQRIKNIPLTSHNLRKNTAKCELLRGKLFALNPEAVLNRGYAIVKNLDGQVITSTKLLTPQTELILQLKDGELRMRVSN